MKMILNSWEIYSKARVIAKINCLSKHSYLIKFYWGHNFRNIIRNILYRRNNRINQDSIVEALTK